MAKIEKESKIPNITTGILMPALANRWRAVINSRRTEHEWDLFSMQVVRCSVSYKTKIIDILVEQNIRADLHEVIFELMSKPFQFRIDCLDGGTDGVGGVYYSTEFMEARVVSHELDYNYANSGTLKHHLVLSFDSLQMLEIKPKETIQT